MSDRFATSPCKGCGKPIVWVRVGDKNIPCDPRPPVYLIREPDAPRYVGDRLLHAMVSHFATCPEASQFSSSKRKQQEGEGT